ncbi:MAG: hypothetical protein ACRDS0_04740, partial [Pseudonocardiaceae bacterium]
GGHVRHIAGRVGVRKYVLNSRTGSGSYQLRLPEARCRKKVSSMSVEVLVTRLRLSERLLMGFLDPVEDAVFLTAGLRLLGIPASLLLGRELAPVEPPAGFYAWVQHGGDVVSTSLPVAEEYLVVYRAAANNPATCHAD